MSEQSADRPAPTPGTAEPVTDEKSAVAAVGAMLGRMENPAPQPPSTPDEPSPSPDQDQPDEALDPEQDEAPHAGEQAPEGDETPPEDAADDSADEAPLEEAPPEGEDGEAAEVEIPTNLTELAKHFGVDAADLATELRIPYRDANGDTGWITVAEASRGTLRDADYSKKTQQLSEDRRTFETHIQQAHQQVGQKLQQTQALTMVLAKQLQQGPDQDALDRMADPTSPEHDPDRWQHLTAQRQAQGRAVQQAAAHLQQQEQERLQAVQAQQMTIREESQRTWSTMHPEYQDGEEMAGFERDVGKYLLSKGFSAQEVDEYFDGAWQARHLDIVRDGMKYRQLQDGRKKLTKKLKSVPKTQRPGSASETGAIQRSGTESARTRMNRSGSDDDARAFVSGLLGDMDRKAQPRRRK